jgi:uncharacterized protein YodC (DUF2158 family)
MAKWKPGDTVKLKQTDGPNMTVQHYTPIVFSDTPSTTVVCKWFDKQHIPHEDVFEEDGLESVVS